MCGIAGCVGEQSEIGTLAVRTMTDALARRGPDSDGLAEWPGAVLGHRRLAILDLSPAGHQPMLADGGQVGLVFNGCIYNFREIREELEQMGHRFWSQCDTEVLLTGFRVWGIDALAPRLHGMFAVAFWDQKRETLTLLRDRLGVKPLVYCIRNGRLAFASTIAALRSAGFGGEIDEQAVMEYLEFGYVTGDRSIFRDIAKLPPGAILEWKSGEIQQRTYWTLPEINESSRCTFEEAVEETERLLVEAVRLRLVSDVPIAVLLSGGIDSGLVCWALQQLNANVKAFTVSAGNDHTDESADAAHTAQKLGISHEIVGMPDRDFSLDALTDAYSEPFSCQSAQAMLWVSKAVKSVATVLLTGDGGDDVFLGYPFFDNAWSAQRLARRMPPAAAALWSASGRLLPRRGVLGRAGNFMDYAAGGLGPHIRAHNGLPYYDKLSILGERLHGRQIPLRQIPASPAAGRRLLSDVFAYHRNVHFTSEFMEKVDGATMYYALEARAPFLDQKIWEFAAKLRPELRLRGGRLKAILREIALRRLGPEVAFRRKQGFTVPAERWYAERWSGMLDRLRGGTLLERQGWIRKGALDTPVRDALQAGWVPPQMVHLLVLEHWLEKNTAPRNTATRTEHAPLADR